MVDLTVLASAALVVWLFVFVSIVFLERWMK